MIQFRYGSQPCFCLGITFSFTRQCSYFCFNMDLGDYSHFRIHREIQKSRLGTEASTITIRVSLYLRDCFEKVLHSTRHLAIQSAWKAQYRPLPRLQNAARRVRPNRINSKALRCAPRTRTSTRTPTTPGTPLQLCAIFRYRLYDKGRIHPNDYICPFIKSGYRLPISRRLHNDKCSITGYEDPH